MSASKGINGFRLVASHSHSCVLCLLEITAVCKVYVLSTEIQNHLLIKINTLSKARNLPYMYICSSKSNASYLFPWKTIDTKSRTTLLNRANSQLWNPIFSTQSQSFADLRRWADWGALHFVMWQLCMAVWNMVCLSYRCNHCWNAPTASLCIQCLVCINFWQESVNVYGCNVFRDSIPPVFFILACQTPFCQTAPLLPCVTQQQNIWEYWQEGLAASATPPTSAFDVEPRNKIGGITFRATISV